MRTGMAVLTAFVGGAIAGTVAGLLFAPERGAEQRRKIKEALDKCGVRLCKEDFNKLVDNMKPGRKTENNPQEDYDAE